MRLLLRSLVHRVYQPCAGVTANLRRAGVTARSAQTSDSATPARPRAWRKSCFVGSTSKALKEAQCRLSWLQAVNDRFSRRGIRGRAKREQQLATHKRASAMAAHHVRAATRHRQASTPSRTPAIRDGRSARRGRSPSSTRRTYAGKHHIADSMATRLHGIEPRSVTTSAGASTR